MKNNLMEHSGLIAKRRKQFIAFLFGVVMALLPTVDVMAATYALVGNGNKFVLNDDGSDIPLSIGSNDNFLVYYAARSGSGGMRLTVKYLNSNKEIDSGTDAGSDGDPRYFPTYNDQNDTIGDKGIANFDHWQLVGNSFELRDQDHYANGVLTLQAALNNVGLTVSHEPENAGTASAPQNTVNAGDTQPIGLNATENQGFLFKEWEVVKGNAGQDGNVKLTDPTSAKTTFTVENLYENIEIKAHFVPEYTITFDANGGTIGGKESVTKKTDKNGKIDGKNTVELDTDEKGKLTKTPDDPTKGDSKFLGWFDSEKGGSKIDPATAVFDKDTTVYAHWDDKQEGTVLIKFDANGGMGEMEDQTVDKGGATQLHENEFTRDGYSFANWNTQADGKGASYDDKDYITAEKDTTLYAQWERGKIKPWPGKHDDDEETEEPSKPAVVNPDTVEGYFAVNGQPVPGVAMGKTVQGVAAQAVFNATRPAGFLQAFTFNMAVNGKVDYTLKNGVLTIIIPKEFQKAGRTFAIMALDKNGRAWTYADTDTNPNTLTATINVEGYAFALIYKD